MTDIERFNQTIADLESGKVRVAEKVNGEWVVNSWVKEVILSGFRLGKLTDMTQGQFSFFDKDTIPTRTFTAENGVRIVPGGSSVRSGAYLAPSVIMMPPAYVNIGAYVDTGTMVDTWATVGSCAQIGKHVHLSGGVGIGGVLEPVQAAPVIIEDNCFIGSRAIVVEGAHICREAVLGSNVVITGSTHIIDVTGSEPITYKGYVPARAVVVPGSYRKQFPAGEYSVSCALIIGHRKESTDKKTSLNDALRDFGVSA